MPDVKEFPPFMRSPLNRIGRQSQYTEGIDGYYFTGADGNQMAHWTCYHYRDSQEHTHEFDEYFVVVQGKYTIIIDGRETPYEKGQECYIPKGTAHSGRAIAGTRIIHCFGGKRVP